MDKAPDAFRTISEVADDLDIPQHVLRFWETRFAQIKPMKRSGGRRYYRPDDVDLLRGIRRLLYGEGYTIRGVQRILKEQGVKAVQGYAGGPPIPDGPASADAAEAMARPVHSEMAGHHPDESDDAMDDDGPHIEPPEDDADEDAPALMARAPDIVAARPPLVDGPREPVFTSAPRAPRMQPNETPPRKLDTARLEAVLQELMACRDLIDGALNDRPEPA